MAVATDNENTEDISTESDNSAIITGDEQEDSESELDSELDSESH